MGVKTAAMKPQINRFFERIINMIIDRERVKNTFAEYTSGYNATDPKIKLKIDHTYRVAELCENGIYGLIGPNGSGKSTIMNIMSDVLDMSSGKILYNGTDIKELDDRYREKIGFLPQNVGYYPNFTAKKTIEYFGYLRGVNKKELDSNVEQVLRDVNLYENRNDKVKSFSGGMKQRLGIAITCVANPEIIIFDEPTVGLDPEERARFKNLIRKLSKTKTIVLSTHILSDVEEVADYIILIKEGCLTKFEKIGGKDNE